MKKSTLLIALIMFLAGISSNANNNLQKFKQQIEKLSDSDFKLVKKEYLQGQAQFEFYNLKLNFKYKKHMFDLNLEKVKMVNFPQKNIEDIINSIIFKKNELNEIKNFANSFIESLNNKTSKKIEFTINHNYKITYNSNDLLSIEESKYNTMNYSDDEDGDNQREENSYIFDLLNGNKLELTDIIDISKEPAMKNNYWDKFLFWAYGDNKPEEIDINKEDFTISDIFLTNDNKIMILYKTPYSRDMYGPEALLEFSFKEFKPYMKKGSPLERIIK